MLVDHRPRQIPVENLPAVAHGKGEPDPLLIRQPVQQDRHREGAGLRIRHVAVREPAGEPARGVARQTLPVAQRGDDSARVRHHLSSM